MSKARVTYSLNKTVNTGNYENFKVGVELVLECDTDHTEQAFAEAKVFVRDKVEGEVAELLGKTDDRIEDDD
jgi:hypothetical protein